MGMDLYLLVDSNAIEEAALKHPSLKVKAKSARRPTEDQLVAALLAETRNAVADAIAGQVKPIVGDAYDNHVINEGEYAEQDEGNKDNWTSALDEDVENAIEPWVEHLSQDWLGRETIDIRLYEEGGVDNFCQSLGQEYFKQVTYDSENRREASARSILSSAGFGGENITAIYEKLVAPSPAEQKEASEEDAKTLHAIVETMAEYLGKDFDLMQVYDDLDLASGDDAILANGAAPRLGISEADVMVLQGERLVFVPGELGGDFMEDLQHKIQAVLDGAKKSKPAKEKPAREKKEKPAPKAEDSSAASEGEEAIDSSVLQALKDSGASDQVIADGLGLARSSYNNHVKGKTEFVPDVDQLMFLRDEVVSRINRLHEALAAIDKTEAVVVD